ncbi:MAG: hypothetical protein IT532_00820 [Burkholderiales bacterium]|nr:hypothetical protein [Burkholderiales bacterium]
MSRLGPYVVAIVLAALALSPALHAQDSLQYQKRDNRFEGIKPKPVSGFDVELLAAQIDYHEDAPDLGERLHARFYLDRQRSVNLVVRELDYKHYYWLDRVEPHDPWRAGFGNTFEWPTGEVLKQLRGLQPHDLGVVARLDKPNPSADEAVAPVVLYQSDPPRSADSYVFYFRVREESVLKASIFPESGDRAVFSQDFGRQAGGRPFAVKWTGASAVPAGRYRLVLRGFVSSTNDPIVQVVRFYHQPKVGG